MIDVNDITGEPVYFISLADGNEFPNVFTKWKNGFIQIPVKRIYDTVTQQTEIRFSEEEKIKRLKLLEEKKLELVELTKEKDELQHLNLIEEEKQERLKSLNAKEDAIRRLIESLSRKTIIHECIAHKCRFDNEHVGSDKNYHFFLSEVHFTKTSTIDEIFMINIFLVAKDRVIKKSRGKPAPRIAKQVEPWSFEINCPIIQFV